MRPTRSWAIQRNAASTTSWERTGRRELEPSKVRVEQAVADPQVPTSNLKERALVIFSSSSSPEGIVGADSERVQAGDFQLQTKPAAGLLEDEISRETFWSLSWRPSGAPCER